MATAFGAPKSEKGYIALGITFIFVGSLFLILMIAVWIINPQGTDLVSTSIILLIFASIFIILGIVFIVKRETLLERRMARADRFF